MKNEKLEMLYLMQRLKRAEDETETEAAAGDKAHGDQTVTAETPAEATEGENGAVELSFSSETVIRHYGYDLMLDHSTADAADLSLLNSMGVVLFNHNRDKVLGKILSAEIDTISRKGRAKIQFDPDDESQVIAEKVRNKTLQGVSVCFDVIDYEELESREEGVPLFKVTKWKALEISIVSLPADTSVGVGRCRRFFKKEKAAVTQEEEAARVTGIMRISREAGFSEDETARYISDKAVTVDAVRAEAYERMTKKAKSEDKMGLATMMKDEADKRRAAARDGLLMRAGQMIQKPADGAGDFRGLSLAEIARDILKNSGERVNGMDRRELAKRALHQRNYYGTSDFPLILGDVVNKIVTAAYAEVPVTYPVWTRKGIVPDLRPVNNIDFSSAPNLSKVEEGAEYQYAVFGESKESYVLAKYGKKFSITEEAIINDDMKVFTRVPVLLATAGRRTVNRLAYMALAGNVKMSDGKGLFHADHGNLAGTSSAPGVVSIGEGRKAMRTQKSGDGTLNIAPKYILVPAALETRVEQLLGSIADPDANHAGVINPIRSLVQVTDSELDTFSATAWYLAADTNAIDTVEVGFLDGNDAPVVDWQEDFDRDGITYKVKTYAAAKALNYRGLYKNAGA